MVMVEIILNFLRGKINKNFLRKYLNKHGYIMCQKYLPGIIDGDKRVFIINGKIAGSISRVPKRFFFKQFEQGGKAITSILSKKRKKFLI